MEDPTIIRLNIRHYRTLLQVNLDDDKRQRVAQLLAEAEAELSQADPLQALAASVEKGS